MPGTWREQVISPADRAIPVPQAISDEDAAQALINPMTAWAMTVSEHQLGCGDWLVQSAAGSTVGRLVLQIAKAQGFRTINLDRREEQVTEIKALGGDVVLCTADQNWSEQLKTATGGNGIAKAIDCVAAARAPRLRVNWPRMDACSSMEPCRRIVRLAPQPLRCRFSPAAQLMGRQCDRLRSR
ncbi:zinc-binding dehydrogenase [Paraburkholderia sp. BR13439]|uniref:zinc-binding dehydrogenase n=1 Tax=Paraburkholderia sp. BR13439 TaxID=3236996 RepID=UPI0034CFDB7F